MNFQFKIELSLFFRFNGNDSEIILTCTSSTALKKRENYFIWKERKNRVGIISFYLTVQIIDDFLFCINHLWNESMNYFLLHKFSLLAKYQLTNSTNSGHTLINTPQAPLFYLA